MYSTISSKKEGEDGATGAEHDPIAATSRVAGKGGGRLATGEWLVEGDGDHETRERLLNIPRAAGRG